MKRKLLHIMLVIALVFSMISVPTMADVPDTPSDPSGNTTTEATEAPHKHIALSPKQKKVPSTCTEHGKKEYWQCTDPDCTKFFYYDDNGEPKDIEGDVEEWADIPNLSHDKGEGETSGKPASCTEDGYKEYWKCTNGCDKYFYTEDNEAKEIGDDNALEEWKKNAGFLHAGHIYGDFEDGPIQTKASNQKDGVMIRVRTCKVCGDEDTKEVTIPRIDKITFKTTEYNGKAKKPENYISTVTDVKKKTIKLSSDDYTVALANKDNLKDVGVKKLKITFTDKCDYYEGTVEANFTIIPPKKYDLTLTCKPGKDATTFKIASLVGTTSATFDLNKKYTKGNYKFKLSKDKKTITIYHSKLKVDKADQTFKVGVKIKGKKSSYTTTVNIVLGKPTITPKKDGKDTLVWFSYKYPKNTSITIEITEIKDLSKKLNEKAKKYKDKKLKFTIKKSTAEKNNNVLHYEITVKGKGNKKWKGKTYKGEIKLF